MTTVPLRDTPLQPELYQRNQKTGTSIRKIFRFEIVGAGEPQTIGVSVPTLLSSGCRNSGPSSGCRFAIRDQSKVVSSPIALQVHFLHAKTKFAATCSPIQV